VPELKSADLQIAKGDAFVNDPAVPKEWLQGRMAEPHIQSGRLVEVLSPYSADGPPISVPFASSRNLAPKVRAFIDFVTDVLAE
jgi:DNA-binding transcriptional LysR family regulator